MQENMNTVYWVIGALFIMNFGTVVTVLFAAFKGVWWLSKLDTRVERNTKDIHKAHEAVRDMKQFIVEEFKQLRHN